MEQDFRDNSTVASTSADVSITSGYGVTTNEGGEGESSLRERLDLLTVELERSESQKKSIADHASYLESALSAAQHDLAESESVNETLRSEISGLKSKISSLESDRTDSAAAVATKEEEIFGLKREIEDLQVKAAAVEDKLRDSEAESKDEEKKSSEMERKNLELEEKGLELKNKISELEKDNSELEKKITEFGGKIYELEKKNSDLDRKVELYEQSKTYAGQNIKVNGVKENVNLQGKMDNGLQVSWHAAAGLATASATVAVAATTIYLRSRQG